MTESGSVPGGGVTPDPESPEDSDKLPPGSPFMRFQVPNQSPPPPAPSDARPSTPRMEFDPAAFHRVAKPAPTGWAVLGRVLSGCLIVGGAIFGIAQGHQSSQPIQPPVPTPEAGVGDCVEYDQAQQDVPPTIVPCASATAAYQVVGVIDSVTYNEFNGNGFSLTGSSVCDSYSSATSAIWFGQEFGSGYVLCVADNPLYSPTPSASSS